MAINQRPELGRVQRHGDSHAVVLPKRIMQLLGWNRHDIVNMQVVQGALVLSRIDLPKVTELPREIEQSA